MIKSLIKQLKLNHIRGYKEIDGWLSDNEALCLYDIARKLPKNAIVVEIGSWQGKSTYCISKGLRSGKVFAIDPFNADGGLDKLSTIEYKQRNDGIDLLKIFKTNMMKGNVLDKIIIKKGYSFDFYNEFQKINFLFIDGDHSLDGCKKDFDLYSNKIVIGGFIAYHDYYIERLDLGPTYVINELVLKSEDFIFIKQCDSLWVGKRIK